MDHAHSRSGKKKRKRNRKPKRVNANVILSRIYELRIPNPLQETNRKALLVKVQCRDLSVNKQIEETYFVHAQDKDSRIWVDCSLNNTLAAFSSSFVKAVVDYDISIKKFLVLIKEFARCQGLNNVNSDTLPSVGHCYLGIFYLVRNHICPQFLGKDEISDVKDLEKETMTYQNISEQFPRPVATPVDTLIQGYFNYYSNQHNFKTMAISLRGGNLVRKETLGWLVEDGHFVGIADPFSGGENVGRAVTAAGLKEIEQAFKIAHGYVKKGEFRMLFRPFSK